VKSMRRLRVLLLPLKDHFEPWCDDVIQAVGEHHELSVFDDTQPLAPQFDGIEVVIDQGGSVGTRAMMDVATDARLWQILGTGFDHFDLEYIRGKGIGVANCPGQFSSVALAETAMMFILMLGHRYREGESNFRSGVLYEPMGRELGDLNLGIIGFGASGQELARRAKGFGMRILGIDVRTIEPEILEELQPDLIGTPSDMDNVVADSDFLSLHLHLNVETRHIIDERRLGLMKPSACLINVARGALVDESALYQALTDGRLGGAGLDVFDQEPPDPTLPVFQLPNVVVTPHIAGVTYETSRNRAMCAAQNVDRIAQELEPFYRIDISA
jgi:phosphoglycerate dehydrogenase-like enzyme